jgi:hypothetical protein
MRLGASRQEGFDEGVDLKTRRKLHHVEASAARRAIDDPIWDTGNTVLYRLCAREPKHTKDAVIVAKLWLIGRSYAAAIERGVSGKYSGDKLYTQLATRVLKGSKIDTILAGVRALRRPEVDTVALAHKAIVKVFRRISGHDNPSLASKYMHFHCPRIVYIYDSRAMSAIRRVTKPVKPPPAKTVLKSPYALFFLRCEVFRKTLEKKLHRKLNPRDVDKVLLTLYRPRSDRQPAGRRE